VVAIKDEADRLCDAFDTRRASEIFHRGRRRAGLALLTAAPRL